MGFIRTIVQDAGGLMRASRAGDGLPCPLINTDAADTAHVLTAAQVAGGIVQFTGFTAGRVITTDSAVNLLALMANADIGDSMLIEVSVVPAFALTWAAGAGVTLAGRATVPASSSCPVVITKTSATTVTQTTL